MSGDPSALGGSGLLAIFVVMLLKEAGVPVPVPSDLIMIGAGVQAATGSYSLLTLLFAVAVAVAVGSTIQFLVVRGAGRRAVERFGRFAGLTPARLDRSTSTLRGRGSLAIFVGLNVPGARAGIIIAAGLAGLAYRTIAPAMIAGSSLYHGWHIALGFLVGPSALALLGAVNLPLGAAVAGLALLGLLGWLVFRRRRAGAAIHAWTAAACPACLAVTALRASSQNTEFSSQ